MITDCDENICVKTSHLGRDVVQYGVNVTTLHFPS
jgi:hypothetical protein